MMTDANMTANSTTVPAADDEPMYYSLLGVLGSLAVLFNGMLLFVLFCNKNSEFCSGTSYIIRNLALADCLTGVAVLIYVFQVQSLVLFQFSMIWTTVEASVMSLVVLSIERFIAFRYPFTWSTIVTPSRTRMVSGVIWLLSIACGVAVYYYRVLVQFALTVVFEVCVLVFLIIHGMIFANLRERNRQLMLLRQDISTVTMKMMNQSMNFNVTKVVLVLIAVVTITVLPYMITIQFLLWATLGFQPELSNTTIARTVKCINYLYPIELINFIVNPVIYAWRLKRYRRAFVNTFTRPLRALWFTNSQQSHGSSIVRMQDGSESRGKSSRNTKV